MGRYAGSNTDGGIELKASHKGLKHPSYPQEPRPPVQPYALTIPPPATVAARSSLRPQPHPHSSFGLPQSA